MSTTPRCSMSVRCDFAGGLDYTKARQCGLVGTTNGTATVLAAGGGCPGNGVDVQPGHHPGGRAPKHLIVTETVRECAGSLVLWQRDRQ